MTGSRRKVIVIAAHPDDEVLGCAGTICRHVEIGDSVDISILAEGATSRGSTGGDETQMTEVEALKMAARHAAEQLGANPPVFCGFPDNRMDSIPLLDIVKTVEKIVDGIQPDIIYTHYGFDLNVDHRITNQAVVTACRPLPGKIKPNIYAFETLSSTEWASNPVRGAFDPDFFVNIDGYLERKIGALKSYEMELCNFPHPRSEDGICHLAHFRGATAGFKAAEAFETIRSTWK